MDLTTSIALLDFIIAASAAGGVIYGGWRMVRNRVRKWWLPYSLGIKAIAQFPKLQQDVQGIRAQVSPNGGSSLSDAVNRTEKSVKALASNVALLSGTMRANADSDPRRALFECDADGENIWVNKTYMRWVNNSASELLGWGFINVIHTDDQDRVRNEWSRALKEERQYNLRHRITAGDGSAISVETVATPISVDGKIERWVGVIRRLDSSYYEDDCR